MVTFVRTAFILAFALAGTSTHGGEHTDLVLKGQATLRYAWVVDVYEARLCGPSHGQPTSGFTGRITAECSVIW